MFLRIIFRGSPSLRSLPVLTKVIDSADSARPIHYSTFDASPPSPAPSPSPPSSLTHVHRCIGSRNTARQILPTSAKLMYLCMYDSRNGVTQCTTRFQETWLQIGFPCQLKLVCRQKPVPSLPRSWHTTHSTRFRKLLHNV